MSWLVLEIIAAVDCTSTHCRFNKASKDQGRTKKRAHSSLGSSIFNCMYCRTLGKVLTVIFFVCEKRNGIEGAIMFGCVRAINDSMTEAASSTHLESRLETNIVFRFAFK